MRGLTTHRMQVILGTPLRLDTFGRQHEQHDLDEMVRGYENQFHAIRLPLDYRARYETPSVYPMDELVFERVKFSTLVRTEHGDHDYYSTALVPQNMSHNFSQTSDQRLQQLEEENIKLREQLMLCTPQKYMMPKKQLATQEQHFDESLFKLESD